MIFEDDEKAGGVRRKTSAESGADTEKTTDEAAHSPRPRKRLPASDVGSALKKAYQRTVDEDIPPEMLDLLGKLG